MELADRIRACIEAFVAGWNEQDAEKRAKLLARACADDFVMRTSGSRWLVPHRRARDSSSEDLHGESAVKYSF